MTTTRFVHLTDTHIQPAADRMYGIDTMQNLRDTLDLLRARGLAPHLPVVISGDLANNGEPESYTRLRAVVEEMRAAGTPVMLALGNHDNRAIFRTVMLGEAEQDPAPPYYYREMLGDLRLIVLDTSVPGLATGVLDNAQRAWLADELATSAPAGTILVMHHPPTLTPLRDGRTGPALDGPALAETEALANLIAGRDVLGILAGHVHLAAMRTLAGVPYITAAGTAFLLDPFERDGLRFLAGGGINIVTVTDRHLDVKPLALPGTGTEIAHRRAADLAALHA